MALAGFHPVVQRWCGGRFSEATEPQQRAWPVIQNGGDVLIAAPTGSGKTFAAFLSAIDGLVRQGLEGTLKDEIQVLYVSPLKALSNDVQKNLSEPLAAIRDRMRAEGLPDVEVRTLLRSGDRPQSERQAMQHRARHSAVNATGHHDRLSTDKRAGAEQRPKRAEIEAEIDAAALEKG